MVMSSYVPQKAATSRTLDQPTQAPAQPGPSLVAVPAAAQVTVAVGSKLRSTASKFAPSVPGAPALSAGDLVDVLSYVPDIFHESVGRCNQTQLAQQQNSQGQ